MNSIERAPPAARADLPYRSTDVAEVLAASFRLQRGDISKESWLQKLAAMTRADGASVFTWHAGVASHYRHCGFGSAPKLPAAWRSWLDTAIDHSADREPELVDELLAAQETAPAPGATPLIDTARDLLIMVDWRPARTVFSLTRSGSGSPWTEAERAALLQFGPYLRESCLLHKHLDSYIDISRISNAIFNSSPRGMMLLKHDGSVPIANFKAQQLSTRDDGIAVREGRLQISDPTVMSELTMVLRGLDSLERQDLHELRWFWSVAGKAREIPYQLALQIILLPEWNLESRFSDRVALLFVNDPTSVSRPSVEELRQYYGLTGAQARLVLALWGGLSIKEAAENLSISIHTVRSHLRSIYATTGTRSHAELMSVLTATLVRGQSGPQPAEPGRP